VKLLQRQACRCPRRRPNHSRPNHDKPVALAEAATRQAPSPPQQPRPVIVHQEESVFADVLETPDLVQLIVGGLQLADVALVALQINRAFHAAARGRVAKLWPKVSRLLASPFNLSRRDLLRKDYLNLRDKRINAARCTALAEACAMGALPNLVVLQLCEDKIGDVGITALAQSCAKGGLPALVELHLYDNQVGDAGMVSLPRLSARGPCRSSITLSSPATSSGTRAWLPSPSPSATAHCLLCARSRLGTTMWATLAWLHFCCTFGGHRQGGVAKLQHHCFVWKPRPEPRQQ